MEKSYPKTELYPVEGLQEAAEFEQALRQERDEIDAQLRELEADWEEASGNARAAITRKMTPLKEQRKEIVGAIDHATPAGRLEALEPALKFMYDRYRDYQKTKENFLNRFEQMPHTAIEWNASRLVEATEKLIVAMKVIVGADSFTLDQTEDILNEFKRHGCPIEVCDRLNWFMEDYISRIDIRTYHSSNPYANLVDYQEQEARADFFNRMSSWYGTSLEQAARRYQMQLALEGRLGMTERSDGLPVMTVVDLDKIAVITDDPNDFEDFELGNEVRKVFTYR